MSNALTPALAVASRAVIRRRRELPLSGEIFAEVGSSVSGDAIIARAALEGELRLVRAAEALGIPAKDLPAALAIGEGALVQEGEVLAEMRGLWGLFRTTVTSPIGGVVEFISPSTGHIGVRAPSKPLDLHSYIDGKVVGIEAGRSVVIEAESTFVQGIFGVGGERRGELVVLPVSGDHRLTVADLPTELKGKVLVGGHSPPYEVLRYAAERGAVGFVTGSIDDAALREYVGYDIGVALTGDEDLSMTLILTEGFGAIAMSERVIGVLRRIDGARVSISGATQVRAGALRPEIIGPSVAEGGAEERLERALVEGARVRFIRVPYFGALGSITALPRELRPIETGAMVRVLEARLDDGRQVVVPRANVELV